VKLIYLNKVKFPGSIPATVFSAMNAHGFAENGIETYFIARTNKKKQPDFDFTDYFGFEPNPMLYIRLFSGGFAHTSSNEFFYIRACRWIFEHRDEAFDVIVTRDPGFLPYLVMLKRMLPRVTIIYQSHNFYMDLKKRSDLKPVNKRKYHLFERTCIPHVDGIMALQTAHRDLYRQYTDTPVFHGWPGVARIDEVPAHERMENRTVGYIGSFQDFKGIESVIRCFKQAYQSGWKLILAGGRQENEINFAREVLNRYSLEDRAEITGWLSYEELRKVMRKMTIGLLLLDDTFYNRYLTAPSKLFDYLSGGIPVVASDLPSLRDFIDHDGEALLVPPGDIEAASDALTVLMNESARYRRMFRRALACARDLTWKRVTARMVEFIESVV